MIKKLLAYMLALLLIVTTFPQNVIHADAGPQFKLTISNESPKAGTKFQVTVNGKQLSDLYAYEVNLTYDSSKIEFVSGDSQSGGFAIKPIVDGNKIQIAHTQIGDTPGQNGNALLATLTFRAVSEEATDIVLNTVKLVNSQLDSTLKSVGEKVSANGKTKSSRITLTPVVKVDSATNIATSTVDATAWEQAQKQAESDPSGKGTISLEFPQTTDAKTYLQQIPSYLMSADKKQYQIEINTPIASIVIPSNMFREGELTDSQTELLISRADTSKLDASVQNKVGSHPVIELSVQSGGQTIAFNNPKAPVIVSVPYSPTTEEENNPEHIVVWYIDGEGNINSVKNGKYNSATGLVTFSTTHFSTYAISFVQKSFDDISSVDWAKHAIEVLASKGVINGTTDTQFSPLQQVTRADFLLLLLRTLDLQGPLGERFADVNEGEYYDEAIRIARGLGIANGSGDNQFNPQASITREDMMVLTEKALRISGQLTTDASEADLGSFTDTPEISSYATNSIAALVESGLINGYDNKLYPKGTTTRAEAAQLMYNIYNY